MTLRVHIYIKNQTQRAGGGISPHLLAAADGFKRHGIVPVLLRPEQAAPCDLAVMWSAKKTMCMETGRRALVMERGYVGDRFAWTSMGYDGLNGRADFSNKGMPGDRWRRNFADRMRPWRGNHDGDAVVIMGQVPGDASIRGVDIDQWYSHTAAAIRRAGHKVGFRTHPVAMQRLGYRPCIGVTYGGILGLKGPLEDVLARAKWVVTWNSNSAVDAVLAGVPAVACDGGSMAYAVTGHAVMKPPPMPDRTQWAHDLAYAQWSIEEIRNGDAWEHLKVGMTLDAAGRDAHETGGCNAAA
jgi:hypothetical protein